MSHLMTQTHSRTKTSMYFLRVLVILLVCGQALAGPPVLLEVTEPRNAAVGFALTVSLTIERLATECAKAPLATGEFDSAKRLWDVRNGPYVRAAQGWMVYVEKRLVEKKGEDAARHFVRDTMKNFSDQAALGALEMLHSSPPDDVRCRRWAKIIASGAYDLLAYLEFEQDLKDVRDFHEAIARWNDQNSPLQQGRR